MWDGNNCLRLKIKSALFEDQIAVNFLFGTVWIKGSMECAELSVQCVDLLGCDYQKPQSTSVPTNCSALHSKAKKKKNNHERHNPNSISFVLLPVLNGLLQNINVAITYANLFWCWWLMFPLCMFWLSYPRGLLVRRLAHRCMHTMARKAAETQQPASQSESET